MATEAFAPAKINLTLHVTGRRADGYHLLDSLVVFADVGDRIRIDQGRDLELRVTGPMAAGVPADDSNLVLQAARLAGVTDARIILEKHLPAAAGIGGGSSDAAATLRALWQSHGAEVADALALGADVPVCLMARPSRMSGIGEVVQPVPGMPPIPAVLVNPGVGVSTPEVFRAIAKPENAPMPEIPRFGSVSDCVAWLTDQRNDLQEPARRLAPEIDKVLAALDVEGAMLSRMSGSGATCFGLFPDAASAQSAASRIASARPGWWVQATELGGS